MAVKKSKMIERFKVKYPKINLSAQRLDMIMDKLCKKPEDDATDEAIDQVLTDFDDDFSFSEIAKMDDKSRTLAKDNEKLEEKLKDATKGKKNNDDDDEDDDDDPTKGLGDDVPDYVKKVLKQNAKLIKQNEQLTEKVNNIESGRDTDSKMQQARALFSKSDTLSKIEDDEIKDFLFSKIDTDSETSFEDQIQGLETIYGKMVQDNADSGDYAGGAGGGGKSTKEPTQEAVDSVVDKMNI